MRPSASLFSALQAVTAVSGTVHHGPDYSGMRKVKSFKWERPFPYDGSPPLNTETKCEVEKTFKAEQWTLKDLQAPSPWAPAIDTYMRWHPYLGSWEGAADVDEFLIMEWTDVPTPVREWIDNQQVNRDSPNSKWWLYGVFEKPREGKKMITWPSVAVDQGVTQPKDEDKVALFAPAALYEILPLWVGQGSECEGDMLDLTKYSLHAMDQSVIAWPIKIPDSEQGYVTFTIKAFLVVETDHAQKWRKMWERHYASLRRNQRKLKREERKRAKLDSVEDTDSHVRDEL